MKTKTILCTVCPIGCEIKVAGEGSEIKEIVGNTCERGVGYATNEFLDPKRILTSTVKSENFYLPIISVRTNKPIPKDKQFECMEIIRGTTVEGPFKMGQVVIENILGTGADVVVTKC